MSEVMRRPRRQQLRESNNTQGRMPSTPLEVLGPQVHGAQLLHVLGPQTGEFIQQLRQRLALTLSRLCPSVKGNKGLTLAKLQHHPCSRHPIRAFAVNQVP